MCESEHANVVDVLLTFDEAQTRVLGLGDARRTGTERRMWSAAAGAVLAEDVIAKQDFPAFDASTMDGYAVRAVDVVENDSMRVVGESRAGAIAPEISPKEACRIFTGAPMPRDADAVIMQEDADRDGDTVRFRVAPKAGTFVRKRGEDLRAGDVGVARGTRLTPVQMSMLASLDVEHVMIGKSPRVTIVPTGDELNGKGATAIRESNSTAIVGMATRANAQTQSLPPVPDDLERVTAAFDQELRSCDLLVTIGGVSVGDHDVVRSALEACGVSLDFWRVAIKPGKPLAVGKRGDAIVLGLPGNPVSALVTFALFGIPLLRAMQGDARPLPRRSRARLASRARHATGRFELARARFDDRGDVELLTQQASGALAAFSRADALACLPADVEEIAAGEIIDIYTMTELGL